MRSEFAARVPTLWYGHDIAGQVITRLTADRETLMIVDSSLATRGASDCSARALEVDARSMTATAVGTIADEIVRRAPSVIVAVGGGSVLDATKIASLALAPGHIFEFAIERASRSALTFLPDAPPAVSIVAVPTTLGTSSETNSVSILKNDSGYRLIVGRSLRPRHAIIDPCNLMTLTPATVREGALEAFLRLAGASTSSRRSARGRRDAAALGGALLETASGDVNTAASRLRLARLSAATQRSAALRGQDPYSARHWYLANEVAFVLEVRKMVATAAVIAAVWRRVCSGDPRWGDRESLDEFWMSVVGRIALPLDPPAGIAALIDRWGIPTPPRPTAVEMRRISTATEAAWGNRYPMLAGLFADDFCDLLRDSYWSEGGE